MASLAQQLIGQASTSIREDQGDTLGAVKTGFQLAQHAEQVAAKRAAIEVQKQQLKSSKVASSMKMVEKAFTFPPKARKAYLKGVQGQLEQLGVPLSQTYLDSLNDPVFDHAGQLSAFTEFQRLDKVFRETGEKPPGHEEAEANYIQEVGGQKATEFQQKKLIAETKAESVAVGREQTQQRAEDKATALVTAANKKAVAKAETTFLGVQKDASKRFEKIDSGALAINTAVDDLNAALKTNDTTRFKLGIKKAIAVVEKRVTDKDFALAANRSGILGVIDRVKGAGSQVSKEVVVSFLDSLRGTEREFSTIKESVRSDVLKQARTVSRLPGARSFEELTKDLPGGNGETPPPETFQIREQSFTAEQIRGMVSDAAEQGPLLLDQLAKELGLSLAALKEKVGL